MNSINFFIGLACGVVGLVLCTVAGITRLSGAYHTLGFEAATLLSAGTALMVLSCMVRLYTGDNKRS